MLGVGEYFWRLLPANPILLRVVETGGKKKRDLFIRCGYLALLIVVVLFALISSSNAATGSMSLSDLTTTSKQTFRMMSYLQLTLVALLAPIFTAGAITQEKDSQTYDILLATPLTNGQIVLGSLLSRLFFVIALLISGIPVFSVTQIFGGVAIASIVMSFAIAAATAFVTGSLAMAIATFKVGTRRTIFSFYLFVVIYIVGILLLDQLPYFWIAGPKTATTTSHISWFTGIHPFLALRVILGDPSYRPPEPGMLPATLQGWPFNWYFTNPASFYVTLMFTFSLLLVTPSIVLLRRMAQSTSSLQSWFLQKIKLSTGDRTRKPRTVWFNPIAWREAKTKASAARASILRYGFIACGLAGAIVLVVMFSSYASKPTKYITSNSYDAANHNLFIYGESTYGLPENFTAIQLNGEPATLDALRGYYEVKSVTTALNKRNNTKEVTSLMLGTVPRKLDEKMVRQFLMGMSILEFAVILLIVTNAAASTVTREKEDGSLDLLLTTPITSRYYIWGKLRGLVSFVIPLLAVPVISAAIFVAYDCIRLLKGEANFRWIVLPEAVLVLPGTLIIVAAFASILGMQMSLRCRTTVRAVMSSVGIMLGACGALGWCGYQFLSSGRGSDNAFMLALSSFSPFTVMMLMIDPWETAGRAFNPANPADVASNRILIFIVSWIATGAYALAVWTMYKSMVKNFDMTIRRQSR